MSLELFVTPRGFFQYTEFTVSREYPEVAKKIILTPVERQRLKLWCEGCGDPWRLAHPKIPIYILNGKRSPELNDLVGGSPSSTHIDAAAVDFTCKNIAMEEVFISILQMNLPYRELFFYEKKNFIHWGINYPEKPYKRIAKIVLR